MKKDLVRAVKDSIKTLGLETVPDIEVVVPPRESFGDLATPVAISLSEILKKPPREIAKELVDSIKDKTLFERIDIADPGFINFTFSKGYLYSGIKRLIKDREKFLREDIGKGKKVKIEFISANPTGPLHLGHGRGGAFGNALANLLSASGYKVEREYYINDAGKQVKLLGLSVFARYQELLGVQYTFPEDGYQGRYVTTIAEEIIKSFGDKYKNKDFEEVADFFVDISINMVLEDIKKDLETFGISFDKWQSERQLYSLEDVSPTHKDVLSPVEVSINYLKDKGYVYEKDSALWFKATQFGDEKDRVIIKSNGEYTYFASDIAYHLKKIKAGFDELINIWGADHHGYIPRIRAVVEALGYPKEKLRIQLVQMVTLLRGGKPVQMSKRSGDFVTLREVMDEVGVDATKFIFLTRRPDSHLEFDMDTAKAKSLENPVFYVQYANARINSIFEHAMQRCINTERLYEANFELLSTHEELRIIKKLLMYPMIFEGAVNAYEPHRITFYLQELSGMFHPYYNKYRILIDDIELTRARLALCEAIRIVLRDGLEILGISAPEKM